MSTKLGATGAMSLLFEQIADGVTPCRQVRLQPSQDGKTIVMIDLDRRKPGVLRSVCYEITPAELMAAIRAHGAELSQSSDEAMAAVQSLQKSLSMTAAPVVEQAATSLS